MTQDNNRITRKHPHVDLVLMVQQKSEASNQSSDSLQ
ncbi:rCG62988 [Rattus norvegicus]|uniref:RCG62988 n=1 Tax=Rattus norvegicus TaxID=10116 RepID=A6HNW7_RAT|nr:rCG62988 [Rattus norvegicus]